MWYFAYGSNMETATLAGRRGVRFSTARGARAAGWRLVLDKPPLVPIGESFANIVPDLGAEVLGVLYEVTPADLEHIELTEGVRIGNYRRVDIPVASLVAPETDVMAATLVSEARDPALRPSIRYMACLIAGAEEHGLPADWIAFLRAVPAGPESRAAAAFRPLIDAVLRRSVGD
jgi:AIG2 family protein